MKWNWVPTLSCIVASAALSFLAVGCASRTELENLREELASLERRFVAEQQRSSQLEASLRDQLHAARRENDQLKTQAQQLEVALGRATNELQKKIVEVEKYESYFEQKKKVAERERGKMKEAVEQTRVANLPAEYPFRAFDVIFVGKQKRDGVVTDYGHFSIRNYTDQTLTGKALSGVGYVSLNIPPNGIREDIFIPASEKQPLRFETNLGTKQYEWQIGWE